MFYCKALFLRQIFRLKFFYICFISAFFAEEVERLTMVHLDRVTRLLFDAFDTHFITSSHLNEFANDDECTWTLTTALFFTTTLLTTIG